MEPTLSIADKLSAFANKLATIAFNFFLEKKLDSFVSKKINDHMDAARILKEGKIFDHKLHEKSKDNDLQRELEIYQEKKFLDIAADRICGKLDDIQFEKAKNIFREQRRLNASILIEADTSIKSNPDFEYENLIEIAEKIISCGDKTKSLLKKVVQSLNINPTSVSLSTIQLIKQFSDDDIDKLKELFRYVSDGYSIIFYSDITKDFRQKGLCQNNSDNIKYLGKIFSDQKHISGKVRRFELTSINIEGLLLWKEAIKSIALNNVPFDESSFSEFCKNDANKASIRSFLDKFELPIYAGNPKVGVLKQPVNEEKINIEIETFVILTEEGQQIFNLLTEDLGAMPQEYFDKIKNFLETKYNHIGLTVSK
jgi:hypothetical protein